MGEDIQHLIEKLSAANNAAKAISATEKLIALGQKGVPDPDWDPLEHPKDKLGRFVKKGFGTYLFGKAKKAIYTTVSALQPNEVDLDPGDKAWAVKTGTYGAGEYMVVERFDGTLTLPHSSGGKTLDPLELKPSGKIAKAFKEGKKTLIKQVPTTEVKAETVEEAKAKINTFEGKTTYDFGPGLPKVALEKNQKIFGIASGMGPEPAYIVTTNGLVDDMYTPKGNLVDDDQWDDQEWQAKLPSGHLLLDGAFPPPEITPYAAPDGSLWTTGAGFQYQKVGGKWKKVKANGEFSAISNTLAHNLEGMWLGEHTGATEAEIESLLTPDPWGNKTAPEFISFEGSIQEGPKFIHPVSGVEYEIGPHESVFQHNSSKNSFIIYDDKHADEARFFDAKGKEKPASPKKHLQFLAKNYSMVYGPDQILPEPGEEKHKAKGGPVEVQESVLPEAEIITEAEPGEIQEHTYLPPDTFKQVTYEGHEYNLEPGQKLWVPKEFEPEPPNFVVITDVDNNPVTLYAINAAGIPKIFPVPEPNNWKEHLDAGETIGDYFLYAQGNLPPKPDDSNTDVSVGNNETYTLKPGESMWKSSIGGYLWVEKADGSAFEVTGGYKSSSPMSAVLWQEHKTANGYTLEAGGLGTSPTAEDKYVTVRGHTYILHPGERLWNDPSDTSAFWVVITDLDNNPLGVFAAGSGKKQDVDLPNSKWKAHFDSGYDPMKKQAEVPLAEWEQELMDITEVEPPTVAEIVAKMKKQIDAADTIEDLYQFKANMDKDDVTTLKGQPDSMKELNLYYAAKKHQIDEGKKPEPEPQFTQPPKGSPVTAHLIAGVKNGGEAKFIHPVSKANYYLEPDETVFQHNKSPDSFVIYNDKYPDQAVFFDKNGKQKPASAKVHLKFLGTNYTPIYGPEQVLPGELAETEGAAKPKTKVAKKAAAKATLPHEWADPDGEVHTLKPGQSVFVKPDVTSYYIAKEVLIDAKGDGTIWLGDGTKKTWGIESKTSYKKAGYTLIADYPLPKLGESTAKPEATFTTIEEAQDYVEGAVKKLADKVGMKKAYWGSYSPSGEGLYSGDWSNYQMMEFLADQDFRSMLETVAATLNGPAIKKLEGYAADKAALSKYRTRFMVYAEMSRLAQLLTDSDSDLTEITELYGLVDAKLDKAGSTFGKAFPLDAYQLKNTFEQAFLSWKFKQTLTGIDFDPDTASLEVLSDYATKKGEPMVAQLSLADAQKWVKIDLGDPGVSTYPSPQDAKEALIVQAKINFVSSKAQLFLKDLQKKTKSTETKKTEAAAKKAKKAADAAIQAQVKNLYTAYTNTESADALVYLAPDKWEHKKYATSGTEILTSWEVLKMLSSDAHWGPVTNVKVNGEGSYKDKITEILQWQGVQALSGLSSESLNKFIKSNGGHNVSNMSNIDKLRWVKLWAAGDKIGLFYLEATNGVLPEKELLTNPGSPGSPEGKAALQMTADFLASQPWFAKVKQDGSFTELSPAEIQSAWLSLEPLAYTSSKYAYSVPPASVKITSLNRWWEARAHNLPKPSFSPQDLLSDTGSSTPPGVDATAWTLVMAAEKGSPDVEEMISSFQAKPSLAPSQLMPFIPENLKKLSGWAVSTPYGTSSSVINAKNQVTKALKVRIAQGGFIPADIPTWKDPWNNEWPLAPGSSIYKVANKFWLLNPDGSGVRIFGPTSFSNVTKDYLPEDAVKILQIPETLTYEKAKSDGLDATQVSWTAVEDVEKDLTGLQTTLPDTNYDSSVLLWMIKDSSITPPTIRDHATELPNSVLKLTAWAVNNGESGTLNVIEYKLKSGYYATLKNQQILDPTKSYTEKVMLGQTTEGDLSSTWSLTEMKDLGADLGVEVETGGIEDAQALAKALQYAFGAPVEEADTGVGLPDGDNLKLAKTGKKQGGMHSGWTYADQNGNPWMTKGFPSDPNGPSRIMQEHASNMIGRLFGFHQPQTHAAYIGADGHVTQVPQGDFLYIQHLKPAKSGEGVLGMGPADLNDEQLSQAMEEHVLDWIISNHDTHSQNLLLDPNDKDVIGIDKGQAFKFFPDDKLQVGWVPSGNGAPVWYDEFYHGVQNGSISKERADKVTKRVLRRAWRIQNRNDKEYRDLLELGLGKRETWPSKYPTKEQYIDALMERKSHLLDTFTEFYKTQVYGPSPYSFDIDVEQLKIAKLGEHTHVAVSYEYVSDVVKSGTHGQSLMVAGEDIEDAHFVFYTELLPNGKMMLRGDSKIRKNGDKKLKKWLDAQTVTDHVGVTSYDAMEDPVDVGVSPYTLPQNDHWFSVIKSAAMTVNHHSPATGGDGEYNQSTLSNMLSVQENMKSELTDLNAWEVIHPNEPYKSLYAQLVTKEQQGAWKEMLEKYINDVDFIEKCKNDGIKVIPHIDKVVYTPTQDLDTSVFDPSQKKPDVIDPAKPPTWIIEAQGSPPAVYTEVEPGKWESNGATFNQSAMDMEVAAAKKNGSKVSLINNPNGEDEVIEAKVTIGLKDVKVIKQHAHGSKGTYDQNKEMLIYSGETKEGYSGYQYDVEFGNTIISYQPWASEVNKAQQGLLQIKVKDWAEEPDTISDVLDVLKVMGLDFQEANEENLELFYWRQLYNVLQDRADRNNPPYDQIRKSFEDARLKAGGKFASESDELMALRAAWALVIGQEKVNNADWHPHFSRMRLAAAEDGTTTGHPHWYRPDFTFKELHNAYGDTASSSSIGNNHHTYDMALSGYLPTEERLRLFSIFEGLSALTGKEEDQEKGSTAYIFTRQGRDSGWGGSVWYHPKVVMRTTNYAFAGDNYGNIDNRKSGAYFNMQKFTAYKGGNDEMQVKYGISFLDDIAVVKFASPALRDAAIKRLHDVGVTEINGFPVEKVFVLNTSEVSAMLHDLWAKILDDEKKGVSVTGKEDYE